MMSGMEWILIGLAIILLFGASRLPKLAKSLGESRKAFKDGMEQAETEFSLEDSGESKKLDGSPSITAMSDDDLAAEMKKRAEAKS